MKEYEINDLDNRARIITSHMPHMESVSLGIWTGIGGRFENKRLQGVSHFIEHLLFKGTKKRSAAQISRAIEGVGGQINAYTAEEYTCYLVKVRGKYQKLALEVLWDMIMNPLLAPADIDKERHVVKEEIHMIIDHPAYYAGEILHELLWPGNPLGRLLLGTEKSVEKMSYSDIRNFKEAHYFPGNMVVSAAGQIDLEQLIEDTKRYTAWMQKGHRPKMKVFTAGQKEPVARIVPRKTEQTHICIGMRAVARDDPDRYAVKLLSIIVGENMSSRLFQVIREKHGLSYDINSSVNYFRDTGGFTVSSGVKTRQIDKFFKLVFRELKRIKKNGVSEGELARAREYYEGQLAMGFEKTMARMLWLGEGLLTVGKVPEIKTVIEKIRKITGEDIIRLAGKIFNRNNVNAAIVGPVKDNLKMDVDL